MDREYGTDMRQIVQLDNIHINVSTSGRILVEIVQKTIEFVY